jgi:hypothetical protein
LEGAGQPTTDGRRRAESMGRDVSMDCVVVGTVLGERGSAVKQGINRETWLFRSADIGVRPKKPF